MPITTCMMGVRFLKPLFLSFLLCQTGAIACHSITMRSRQNNIQHSESLPECLILTEIISLLHYSFSLMSEASRLPHSQSRPLCLLLTPQLTQHFRSLLLWLYLTFYINSLISKYSLRIYQIQGILQVSLGKNVLMPSGTVESY